MPDRIHAHLLVLGLTSVVISATLCALITTLALTAAWTRHTGRRGGALDALALLLHRGRCPSNVVAHPTPPKCTNMRDCRLCRNADDTSDQG